MTGPLTGEDVDRLVGELVRHTRLTPRAKALLVAGAPGSDTSAVMLLPALVHLGPQRVTELADLKQADPSTVSRQAAQLVRAGFARREPDPTDGRATRLAVTPAGRDACRQLTERRRAMLGAALRDWPAHQLATFVELFTRFNDAVEALLRDEGRPAGADAATDRTPQENV